MKLNLSVLLILLIFSFSGCLDLKEIAFISLEANFTPSQSITNVGSPVIFRQQSTEVASTFLWSFGDNTTSTEYEPAHSFDTTGLFTIKLVITKADGITKDSITKTVRVLPPTEVPAEARTYSTDTDLIQGDEFGFCFEKLADGHLIVGRKNLNILYVIRTNAAGDTLLTRQFSNITQGKIVPTDVERDFNGDSFVITGYFQYQTNDHDAFIMRINENGEQDWLIVNATGRDERYTKVIDLGPAYLAVGNVKNINLESSNQISTDIYTKDGALANSENIGSSNWVVSDVKFLRETGEFVLAATEGDTPLLIRYSTTSNEVITTKLPFRGRSLGVEAIPNPTAPNIYEYILIGETTITSSDSTNAFVVRIDQFGNVPNAANTDKVVFYKERLTNITALTNGEIIVSGTHQNPLTGKDVLLLKYSLVNNKLTRKAVSLLGGNKDDEGLQMVFDPASQKAELVGTTESFSKGFRDIYFFKVDKETLK
jgi:hypothetical protein